MATTYGIFDHELRGIIEVNRFISLKNHTKEVPKWVYNFPTYGFAVHNQELTEHLKIINHDVNGQSYKINMMFGMVLKYVDWKI